MFSSVPYCTAALLQSSSGNQTFRIGGVSAHFCDLGFLVFGCWKNQWGDFDVFFLTQHYKHMKDCSMVRRMSTAYDRALGSIKKKLQTVSAKKK